MTREELKVHCEKQIEMCEFWAIGKGEKPSGKVYEEHKLILELLEQEPRWIPVSERLPEDHTNVLFCDIDGDVMLGHHIPREQKAHFVERGSWDMVKNVVAWMPLPESYKEVKDGN